MNHIKFGRIVGSIILLVIIAFIALLITTCVRRRHTHKPVINPPVKKELPAKQEFKLRKKPEKFKPNTYLPRKKESAASGAIDLATFSPGKSLIYIDDKRVWWESDHDKGDIEDDHTIYFTMEKPLRRLIELVVQENATLIILETPLAQRVEITFDEYVTQSLQSYHDRDKEQGDAHWYEEVYAGLNRIKRRLGSERHQHIMKLFTEAYHDRDLEGHKVWIALLLTQYYDPMYDYQIEKSTIPIGFRGNEEEVLRYLGL